MDTHYYILNARGRPERVADWAAYRKWYTKADRVVEQTDIDGYQVSTVFHGQDESHTKLGLSMMWETLVRGREDDRGAPGKWCQMTSHSATLAKAKYEHFRIVAAIEKEMAATPRE